MSEDQIPNTPPLKQFTSEVLPSYDAYMSDMSTIWKARCAAYMVGHFAEHVWFYYNYHDHSQLHGKTKRAEDYVVYLAETYDCQELKIVWDIALSSKHRFLNTVNHIVDGDTGTFVERFVPSSTGALAVDNGRLWMPDVGRCFDDVIKKAVDFWRDWLKTAPTYS